MNLVTSWKRMMAVDVLLRNIQPNWCLATQDTVAVKDQADYAIVAFRFLG